MARKGNPDIEDIDTEYRPAPSNAAKVPKPGARDKSLVRVLVLAKNVPVGVVHDPVVDEDGQAILGEDGQPLLQQVERHLTYRERVMMERWCAEIMASEGREHVEIL